MEIWYMYYTYSSNQHNIAACIVSIYSYDQFLAELFYSYAL